MTNATKVNISTFGVLAGLAGIEHGIGEILQGNTAPAGTVFFSWPESPFFQVLNGEPAMTVIPNLLVTGILAILVSLIFIAWTIWYVPGKRGRLVLSLLSVALLLVGGGFGPPLLGFILSAAATRLNRPSVSPRPEKAVGSRSLFARLWPWSFAIALAVWLLLMPGLSLLDYFFGVNTATFTYLTILCAFGFLLLTLFTGLAYDKQHS